MAKNTSKGIRYDSGKAPVDLVPPEVILALAQNLFRNSKEGGGKYEQRNWEKGMDWQRCYSSLQRHLLAWQMGEDIDSESGEPHLDHALSNIAFLVTYAKRKIGTDNRPAKSKPVRKKRKRF